MTRLDSPQDSPQVRHSEIRVKELSNLGEGGPVLCLKGLLKKSHEFLTTRGQQVMWHHQSWKSKFSRSWTSFKYSLEGNILMCFYVSKSKAMASQRILWLQNLRFETHLWGANASTSNLWHAGWLWGTDQFSLSGINGHPTPEPACPLMERATVGQEKAVAFKCVQPHVSSLAYPPWGERNLGMPVFKACQSL